MYSGETVGGFRDEEEEGDGAADGPAEAGVGAEIGALECDEDGCWAGWDWLWDWVWSRLEELELG